MGERNNIFTLLSYPSISSYFQQHPIGIHLRHLWANKRGEFYIAIGQYVALGLLIGIALFIDWRKAGLYIIIPQQVALFTVMIFNYIQHVHADEEPVGARPMSPRRREAVPRVLLFLFASCKPIYLFC